MCHSEYSFRERLWITQQQQQQQQGRSIEPYERQLQGDSRLASIDYKC